VGPRDAAVLRDAGSAFSIIDRPIRFDAERIRMALEYRRIHSDPSVWSLETVPHTAGHPVEADPSDAEPTQTRGSRYLVQDRMGRTGARWSL
jgi:hypothetical protein